MKQVDIDLLNSYIGKTAFYKESRTFILIRIERVEVNYEAETIFWFCEIISDFHCTYHSENEIVFIEGLPPDWEKLFSFGGNLDYVKYYQDSVRVMYIGEIILDKELIDLFAQKSLAFLDYF